MKRAAGLATSPTADRPALLREHHARPPGLSHPHAHAQGPRRGDYLWESLSRCWDSDGRRSLSS